MTYRIYLTSPYEEPSLAKHNPITLLTSYLKKYIVNTEDESNIIFHNVYTIDKEYIHKNQVKNKINFFIWITDEEGPLILNKNTLVFRTSGNIKNKNNNEYGFSWSAPILYKEQLYSIHTKPLEPIYNNLSLGFCGDKSESSSIRGKCIEHFLKSKISTNFVLRDRFIRFYPDDIQQKYRLVDYIENMQNNIFILTPRGTGNWSLRLYETMAYGRIPVLYDSDMLLPFSDKINWNEIIILGKSSKELEDKVNRWYNKGPEFIIQKQIECRKIWEDYLSMEGFANNLLSYLQI